MDKVVPLIEIYAVARCEQAAESRAMLEEELGPLLLDFGGVAILRGAARAARVGVRGGPGDKAQCGTTG